MQVTKITYNWLIVVEFLLRVFTPLVGVYE